ncbi:P-granule-associated protein deps-1 [Caenorhabditis elegans]|uniref:P-granule-associated protein deps-1 n=2 Tax=Caenorhabditis elegans TaxID=6239 RepID=DEPS1_CAEEL|nr:P-granule-associated protein deps-1 [Caenorhabditis elegans]Q9N303.1 RecName: Full=P-granule-associated protein deps-1; AltName: Full=Defective P granules and sterile protein deps-1 [Caenorhabditis elegans]CCD73489.1 P-granule-associated protein deps-1 [Caenorhabditis elegans]|eukprot:NP_490742.1 Uncharacterized protein CELE_Y65B4BL.2 [Caenorhabditis elegans]
MSERQSKYFDYQGIVISSTGQDNQDSETDLVYLIQAHGKAAPKNIMYGVSKCAFVPTNLERNFDNIEEAKNLERRSKIPLKFGEVILWNESDCDHDKRIILHIKREKPIYEASSSRNGLILKVGGVIQPTSTTSFWTPLCTVTMPETEATRAEPDVWLYAWIRFETTMKSGLDPFNMTATFESFDSCDPSDQARVCEAPWNAGSPDSKFGVWRPDPKPADSDDEIDIEPREGWHLPEDKWAEVIKMQLGLYVGERLLICKELSQFDFIIPLQKPFSRGTDKTLIYPAVGEYFHFSAIWSMQHNGFLIYELQPVPLLRQHVTSVNGNLLTRVVPASIRGLFVDKEGTLGLIDDPHHLLSFFEFHPAGYEFLKAMAEVRAVRTSENKSVRYRIVRTSGMSIFENWLRDTQFVVGPVKGIRINEDTVICAKHPNVYFKIPNNLKEGIPIGGGVQFVGKRQAGVDSEIMITECSPCPAFTCKNYSVSGDTRLFQVYLKPNCDHEQLAESDSMGFVDFRELETPCRGKFLAWVRESITVNDCRRAATIMEVCSTAICPPLIAMSANSSRATSARTTPAGSSIGSRSSIQSRASAATSVSSNRFVGPSSRRTPSGTPQSSTSSRV